MGVVTKSLSVKRFDVFLVALAPTIGTEIQKTRPCVVVSPDELNRHLTNAIVAPMTTVGRNYPTRVPCHFAGKSGMIILDQLRTVDKVRLLKHLGRIPNSEQEAVLDGLAEMFAK